jgi:hypothetical protein
MDHLFISLKELAMTKLVVGDYVRDLDGYFAQVVAIGYLGDIMSMYKDEDISNKEEIELFMQDYQDIYDALSEYVVAIRYIDGSLGIVSDSDVLKKVVV